MITNPEPPFPPSAHDPDTRDKWGRDYSPQPGRVITTVTATVVDDADTPIAGTDLIIDTVAWSLVDSATNRRPRMIFVTSRGPPWCRQNQTEHSAALPRLLSRQSRVWR